LRFAEWIVRYYLSSILKLIARMWAASNLNLKKKKKKNAR